MFQHDYYCFILISVSKGNKSDVRHDGVRFLESRIGNLAAVKKSGALCAGQYNSTLGQNVSFVQSLK